VKRASSLFQTGLRTTVRAASSTGDAGEHLEPPIERPSHASAEPAMAAATINAESADGR